MGDHGGAWIKGQTYPLATVDSWTIPEGAAEEGEEKLGIRDEVEVLCYTVLDFTIWNVTILTDKSELKVMESVRIAINEHRKGDEKELV